MKHKAGFRAVSTDKRDLEFLWKEYFRDPTQWWDNRHKKNGPGSPDFKHKSTKESLWIDNRYNAPWIHQELIKIGPPVSTERNDEEQMFVVLLTACAKEKDVHKGA